MNNKILRLIFKYLVYIFALVGFVLTTGYFAVKFGITNTAGIVDKQREGFYDKNNIDSTKLVWNKGEEWQTLKVAITKDKIVLDKVESETGIPARLISSVVIVEQLRLFFTERETFKQVFAPLKILGTQSQFSWGISGIKPDTAQKTESNLKDKTSSYYLGEKYEHSLDFKTANTDEERFTRLTDYKDRYYSYLYTALYIKELATSWKKSGVNIADRPEILATLFNIGFNNSNPKPNPEVGGAEIKINGTAYSFGGLAGEFYYSGELNDVFPKKNLSLDTNL